ncbi:hypothetical protein Lal_00041630, partial [Lupinus albus]
MTLSLKRGNSRSGEESLAQARFLSLRRESHSLDRVSHFHTQTIVRRKRNKIHGLYLDDGSWHTEPSWLKEEANNYFQSLLCGSSLTDLAKCSVITPTLPLDGVMGLTSLTTIEEVTRV